LAQRYELADPASDQLTALLTALADEPAPPTTITAPKEALNQHLADSLSGLQIDVLRTATRIADLGAGAGFPGLALAVALPDAQIDLIEATRRKCEVIDRLADAAGLANARTIPARAEEWALGEGGEAYDAVTARAVGTLAVLAEYAAPLLKLGGALTAWKGARDPEEEQAGARAAEVLGLEARPPFPLRPYKGSRERNLYVYVKTRPTPERYPRRPGMAAKRPLGAKVRG